MRSLLRRCTVLAALLVLTTPLFAHDMFLRLTDFFVAPNTPITARLFNGTFVLSENSITPDRIDDIALVSPTGRAKVSTTQWNASGDTSVLQLRTGGGGTYIVGVSTRPRVLQMSGNEFNAYLRSDGIPDELAVRRAERRLDQIAKERYQKHVKALVQVGPTTSVHFATVLGYPAELVPIQNPYALKVGATLSLLVLLDGRPVPNQFVQYGGLTATGGRVPQRNIRSDATGIVRIPLSRTGTYYVKFIHMTRLQDDPAANYASKWGSLTFALR